MLSGNDRAAAIEHEVARHHFTDVSVSKTVNLWWCFSDSTYFVIVDLGDVSVARFCATVVHNGGVVLMVTFIRLLEIFISPLSCYFIQSFRWEVGVCT